MSESIKVVLRCRPLNSKEQANGCQRVVDMDLPSGTVTIHNPKADMSDPGRSKAFNFDSVFDWTSTQSQVYNSTGFPIVESVLDGYNGTIFAYGQTGTGKTHTMQGYPPDAKGIIPCSFDHIFEHISGRQGVEFVVLVSYIEIYNEEIRDLLGPDPKAKLNLKEDPDNGVFVQDLSMWGVHSIQDMEKHMEKGNSNRMVGATEMNATSSRSHSIFTITIESGTPRQDGDGKLIKRGKLNLVDLAGSERTLKTGATGVRLKEGIQINKSLLSLGNVISALVSGKSSHIPYRDSKLTRLLQDSLGGNSKTVMVANMGPADYNFEESVSTLRYASRAKMIKNKPKVNEDPKDAMIRKFQEEIALLKKMLEEGGAPGEVPQGVDQGDDEVDPELLKLLQEEGEEERQRIMAEKGMLEEERARVMEKVKEAEAKADAESKQRNEMQLRLASMQDKLLHGGVNLLTQHQQQEADLKQAARELEEKREAEAKLQRELKEKADENLLKEERYNNLQDETEGKKAKLKKIWSTIQSTKSEISDVQREIQSEREEILEEIRTLSSQLKLKQLVLHRFIPPDDLALIEQNSKWDEANQEWRIRYSNLAGNNVRQNKKEVERPLATPLNNSVNFTSPHISPNVYFSYSTKSENISDSPNQSRKTKRPSTASRSNAKKSETPSSMLLIDLENEEQQYPQARGLVRSSSRASGRK